MTKICNEKVPVESGKAMNDLDFLTDILVSVKNMVNNYSYVLNEVSNNKLYDTFQTIFIETSLIQRDLFELMFIKGWYCLEEAEQQKIDETYTKYSNQMSEL